METNDVSILPTFREYYEGIFKYWVELPWDIENLEQHRTKAYKIVHPSLLAKSAIEYFTQKAEHGLPITYTGFILYAGLGNRCSLDLYMSYGEEWKALIEVIKLIIEDFIVNKLYSTHVYGATFLLKTNYGYTETTRQIVETKEYSIGIE